jgi:hypothetical protein
MSWSNRWIGRRAGIKAAIARYAATLSGNSKAEFDAARPHIEGLVDLNTNTDGDPVVDVDANGHAYDNGKGQSYSQTQVTIKAIGALCADPVSAPVIVGNEPE